MEKLSDNLVLFPEQGKLATIIRSRDDVSGIPVLETQETNKGTLIVVPWHDDTCRLLRNIGIDGADKAAPFLWSDMPKVEGMYEPMKHQKETAAFMTLNPRCYVLSDPRTGKTGAIILGMNYLQKKHRIRGAFLIVTTVTTMESVWARSIEKTIPGSRIVIVHGKQREALLKTPADFYITNYDSCRISGVAFMKAVKDGRIGGIVIDELTHVGNAQSARHKSIRQIADSLPYVVGVTGSPAENVEHVYGMGMTVNCGSMPCRTKSAWMDLVTYQYGPEKFMRKPAHNAPDVIYKSLQPAVRYNKKDIIDLPPVVTQDRDCALSAEQTKLLRQFRAQAVAMLDSGDIITAANGGALYNKIMQTAQGFVIGNDGEINYLDAKDRHQTILDAISETSRKVVVFASYKASIARLRDVVSNAGWSVAVINGDVTGGERSRILEAFSNSPDPHVLICHPTTTAYGVELAAADTMIFDGPPPLGGFIYAQALERLSSAKQTANKISILRIVASEDERKYFKALDSGKEMGYFISTLFESYKH